jgi:hypothetical protein
MKGPAVANSSADKMASGDRKYEHVIDKVSEEAKGAPV